MRNFNCMEQRIISMYIDLFPSFKHDQKSNIPELSQNQFYKFIKAIFDTLYDNPLLLFAKINTDDYFTRRFNKHSENKQSTYNKMRKIMKSLQDFSQFLFDIGIKGQVEDELITIEKTYKIPKSYLVVLEQCGIVYSKGEYNHILKHKEYKNIFQCWKWFSTKPEITLPHFVGCMFDANYSYTDEIYSKLSGDEEVFSELEQFFKKHNYIRVDNRDNRITLDYVKNYGSKESVIKSAFADRTHGGISAEYDSLMKNPQLYSLRVPFYKTLLQEFEKAENREKDFIIKTGKKCDNCRYCVQTDKTGKREPAFISVYHNKEYKMCSYFPSFNYCWEYISKSIATNIIIFLTFADKILEKK